MNDHLFRYLARVCIEFETPFHVGAGREGATSDAAVATDASGLPAIPGSSIAGALRAAFTAAFPGQADAIFGFQKHRVASADLPGDKGCGSRLSVSWAAIHDSHNQPVLGIPGPSRLEDSVLAAARRPAERDHVRLNHLGVADDRGKFDESCVQAGHRFTFDLELAGNPADAAAWAALLQLLGSPRLRLGGKTRRGLGRFKAVSLRARAFNLAHRPDFLDYCRPDPPLGQPPASQRDTAGTVAATLVLAPRGYWMFGGGTDPADGVDMAPVRESRIVWHNHHGEPRENLVLIPASSIKGALSHRTAFHYNRLAGRFAGQATPEMLARWTGENNEAIRALFGWCRGSAGDPGGQRGRILLDDAFLEADPPHQIIHHVAIDRFTGGALPSALFQEKPFWQGPPLTVALTVAEPEKITDPQIRAALACALQDLAEGRLALGAGAGRGLGFFTAAAGVQWSEPGQAWLNQPSTTALQP